ncbi:MAG: carbohydrate-binding family 9-like protein [Phycisphaerales bacterium]|nr:carbohydrate-binding family 9-like protein [Phycisphaerales bacterium]
MKIYSVLLPFIGILSAAGHCAEATAIASFEGPDDNPFVARGCVASIVREHATAGLCSLRVEIKANTEGFPGIFLPATDRDWTRKAVIALDVFNPGDEPIALSMQLDSVKDGPVGYGPATLQPGWNRDLAVNVGHYRPYHDFSEVRGLLIGVEKPKKDMTFFIDNVRWTAFNKTFHRIEYLETIPAIRPTAHEDALGFIAFGRHYMSLVFPNSLPDHRIGTIRMFAARGEKEPITINLHPLRDLPSITVTPSDLHGPNGSVIPSSRWDNRLLRHMDKREGYPFDTYVANMPTYLERIAGPVALVKGRTGTFWLTLDVPADCIPGLYKGEVVVLSGTREQTLPLVVRILPFGLPDDHGLLYGEYYLGASKTLLGRDQIRDDLRDMRDHGATSVGLWFTVDPSTYTVDEQGVSFHMRGDSQFEWLMEAYQECGFPGPIIMGFDAGMDAADSLFNYGDPRWDRVYVNFHKALVEETRKQGWPRIHIQPLDEVSWHSNEEKEKNLHLLKLLKSAGIPTEMDGAADAYMAGEAGTYADMWTVSSTFIPSEMLAAARAQGKLTTIYNVDSEGWLPEADRWSRGLYLWNMGLHGVYNWAYRHAYGSYYDDFDSENGENVHAYPAEHHYRGGPSTGWEVSREGIDDLKYLVLLERLIAKGRSAGGLAAQRADEASNQLQTLKDGLDANTDASRGRARWQRTLSPAQAVEQGLVPNSAGVMGYVAGQHKIPNGMTYDEYDAIRWMVATHICGLMEALGEPDCALSPSTSIAKPVEMRVRNIGLQKANSSTDRPELVIGTLASIPEIDGEVNVQGEWASASRVNLTMDNGSGDPQMPTEVYCGIHDSTFYVAAICAEARIHQLTANVKEDGGPVFMDDCIEIFLDPGGMEQRYFQVAVNSLGKVMKIDSGGSPWLAQIKTAARVDLEKRQWTVEMAIPIAQLNLGDRFGLNFCRERRPMDAFELSSWSATGGSFARMDRFGVGLMESGDRQKQPVDPGLNLKVVPGYLVQGQEQISLLIDVRLPLETYANANVQLIIRGEGREIATQIPKPLDERVQVELDVTDLPAGSYKVDAILRGPDMQPRNAGDFFRILRGIE